MWQVFCLAHCWCAPCMVWFDLMRCDTRYVVDIHTGLPKMGDEVVVVDSESTARAIVAQRKKQLEVEELEKQVRFSGI